MRILIAGAGIAGLSLANWLVRAGQTPVVLENAPRLRDEGYLIDFFGPGLDVAETLDLWPDLDAIHYPIPRLRFVDAAGREKFALRYPELRRRVFRDRHFNFLRGDLERVLYDRVKDHADLRFGTTIAEVTQDKSAAHVRLSDGRIESFELVVGADGVHSHVRDIAFDTAGASGCRYLGYRTAAFICAESVPGVPADSFSTLTLPGRQVAVYPIRGGRLATFFVYATPTPLPDPRGVSAELDRVFGDLGWIVPDLLNAARAAPHPYAGAVTQVVLPAWSHGRVVLLGDAAHCVSLLAGQGASLAMAGAYHLAGSLTLAEPNVAAALTRYEQTLRPLVEERQAAGRRMAGWFVPRDGLRLILRDTLTRLATLPLATPFLQREFGLT